MFKILCIDDNKNNLFTLKTILQQLDEIEIITVLSAQEAFSVLLSQEVDLILLDVQMPEMDGFEAAKLIKANRQTADIPIIFLTAIFRSEEFHKKGFEMGAIEYLTKPIDDNKLLNKVHLYQRLIENEKRLNEQKKYMQKIIDLQDQILVVIDNKNIYSANKRFFDFFGFSNLDDFLHSHRCICELFIETEGFLSPSLNEDDKPWLNTVINQPEKMHLAIVRFLNTDVIVSVTATVLDARKKLYVVTLTDVTQMHRRQEAFRHEALTDKLTGAFNRTKFEATFDNAILHVKEKPFTVAILDIDFFKKINDDFGHLVGDSVLKEMVTLIQDNIRNEDLLARWGGEEFMLVFFTSIDKILLHVEKLRILIQEHPFSGVDRAVTISMGVGEYKESTQREVFLRQIDAALYKAKKSGRNRIVNVDELL